MAIDLSKELDRARVIKAIKASREAMSPFRRARTEMLKDYVGSWYSTNGATFNTIVNLMNQTARVFSILLAANNPKVKVSTDDESLRVTSKRFETALNKRIGEMELDQTMRLIVLDAFFSIGVAKVCMAERGQLEAEDDVWYDPGQPWVGRVSTDDLVLDMTAKDWSKMRFCGDLYRVPFDKVKSEASFDRKVVAKLVPTSKNLHESGSETARDISTGSAVDDDDLEPMIWLLDLWIPQNQQVATLAWDTDFPPLVVRDWTGSQGGPYKNLSLGDVPDNVMPSSPASNLKCLHDWVNRLERKLQDQSERQKSNILFQPGDEKWADIQRKAGDGDYIPSRDPRGAAAVSIGGPDAATTALSIGLIDLYDRMAGNLKAAAGLGVQSGTVGQEEIIQGNVTRMAADMHLKVVQFAAEVCWDLGYLIWNDDFSDIEASAEVPGAGVRVESNWGPEHRQGEYERYGFRVEPYSMVYQTPQQRLQEVFGTLDKLAPMWPMFQASGASLDVEALVDIIAELQDRPELRRIITFSAPAQQLGGDQNTVRQAATTTRNTVRRNIPTGGTAENRSAVMQQALMGGGQNTPQQTASMARVPA